MKKAVMISIQPKWVELIAARKKTVEIRKTRPNLDMPFKSYIYMTRINWAFGFLRRLGMKDLADRLMHATGKIIGEFVCDGIAKIHYDVFDGADPGTGGFHHWLDCNDEWAWSLDIKSCLTHEEFKSYLGKKDGYGWNISDLVIYDRPKALKDFCKWTDDLEDIRPCQNGKACEHLFFDYGEDQEACGIDYDGTDCPYLKVQRPPQSWCYVEPLE